MLTKDQLRQLLDGLPDRGTRSGLEPYRDLVVEMRRRKYSYRAISRLLIERCGLGISHSAVHDFVKRHCHETPDSPPTQRAGGRPALDVTHATENQSRESRGPSEHPQAVRERIAAMKRKPSIGVTDDPAFRFDPAQPLRLEDKDA